MARSKLGSWFNFDQTHSTQGYYCTTSAVLGQRIRVRFVDSERQPAQRFRP